MKTLEQSYTNLMGIDHRQQYGQFFTHPTVADFMVRWVLESGIDELYDPAFGLGAFLNSAYDIKQVKFFGSDSDKHIVNYWSEHNSFPAVIKSEDYLQVWDRTWTNIVCNPPYMRFQKFQGRDSTLTTLGKKLGMRLSGYTNVASAFLLKSIHELDGKGRLAYIMPLEFLNTGYGQFVKKVLIENGNLFAIIRLDCEKDIFPEVTTSIGIILYDTKTQFRQVKFYSVSSIDQLASVLKSTPISQIPMNELNPSMKWLNCFSSSRPLLQPKASVLLKHYGQFSRGVATGANEFFALNLEQALRWNLYPNNCVPCITKSTQIRHPLFENEDYYTLLKGKAPVLLFKALEHSSSATQSYIRYGMQQDFHQRYLSKARHPWYKIEHRTPAPILLGVFSRGGYKVIRNRSDAINLTCFHGFQPNLIGWRYLDRLFLYLFSEPGKEIVSMSKRQYGGKLDKFEPNDLNYANCPAEFVLNGLTDADTIIAMDYIQDNQVAPNWLNDYFASHLLKG